VDNTHQLEEGNKKILDLVLTEKVKKDKITIVNQTGACTPG